jgi:hypothetical protein
VILLVAGRLFGLKLYSKKLALMLNADIPGDVTCTSPDVSLGTITLCLADCQSEITMYLIAAWCNDYCNNHG